MKIGDRVLITLPRRSRGITSQRIGTIIGEGKGKSHWNINYDGRSKKSVNGIHKSFCKPYVEATTPAQPTSAIASHRTITET